MRIKSSENVAVRILIAPNKFRGSLEATQVARAMAPGVRRMLHYVVGICVTGTAGQGGGTDGKPKGLTFLCLAAADREISRSELWPGDRRANKESSALAALQMLSDYLEDSANG